MLEHEWDVRSVQFPLTPESVVLDIGGYKGRWAKEIASRYNPNLYVFEPQPWAADIARNELMGYDNAIVFDFGLGVESGHFEMEEFETDGATFMLGRSQRHQSGEGELVEIGEWLEIHKLESIDLVMMNIEGYEFKLIPHMIEGGIMQRVKYFMVQFHPANYEQQDEYEEIRKQLFQIMDVHFDYGIVLCCWKARESVGEEPAPEKPKRKPRQKKAKE